MFGVLNLMLQGPCFEFVVARLARPSTRSEQPPVVTGGEDARHKAGHDGISCGQPSAVVGSIIRRTSVIRFAGKPLLRECSRMIASSFAR